MGSSMWEQEGFPQLKDYKLVFYFALAFPMARLLLDIYIFQALARWIVSPCGKRITAFVKDIEKKKLLKVTESMWKLTYYVSSLVFAFIVTYKEPWFGRSDAFWHGWPNQSIKFQLKVFYTFQCGFYIYSVAALLVWETRRKDFNVMLTHHILTIGLIAFSYITGSFRAGSIVVALHDVTDVLLESAKLCKYAGREVEASFLFAVFALSWLLLRLIYFPFWIIWSTSVEVINYIDMSVPMTKKLYYMFNTSLISLLVIHFYWWILIFRMIQRQLQNRGKVGDDVRSDSDGE
ncbi:hypothetical protein O6H91_15G009500 [Diphasiastrum complanatum]|uniref:Uncharacterized protein n=1 Tax=Diphasiastrum complanatum TaxID=34168 RepID=A0ACC2BFU7_DIPCM|nr:hypothetical protein O6H91_15G009500 [Diphasiastrum complanatum]